MLAPPLEVESSLSLRAVERISPVRCLMDRGTLKGPFDNPPIVELLFFDGNKTLAPLKSRVDAPQITLLDFLKILEKFVQTETQTEKELTNVELQLVRKAGIALEVNNPEISIGLLSIFLRYRPNDKSIKHK